MDRDEIEHRSAPPSNTEASQRLSAEAVAERKWTVAIDLATNLKGLDGKVNGQGAEDKWNRLNDLAAQTSGKPVAFVVSVAKPYDPTKAPVGEVDTSIDDFFKKNESPAPADDSKAATTDPSPLKNALASILYGGALDLKPQIETYVIENGTVRQIEDVRSRGTAGDIEHLLKIAGDVAPSKNLGLIVFSHGTGVDDLGIVGDAGISTLPDVQKSIQEGLGQRQKLDLVVFDGCRMSTTDTASRMQNVAANLVASQDEEIALPEKHTDGITIHASLRDLLSSPDMTGRELARDFITQAKRGVDGLPSRVPYDEHHLRSSVDTLAAIDLTKYSEFQASMNQLGSALDRALVDRRSKDAIAAAIDFTGTMPSRNASHMNYQRDTHQFAERILDQLNKGALKDNGSIRVSAENVIKSQDAMIIDHYGSSNYYRSFGGITAELAASSPSSQLKAARDSTVFGVLLNNAASHGGYRDKDYLTDLSQRVTGLMGMTTAPEWRAEVPHLNKVTLAMKAADNPNSYKAAVRDLKTLVNGLSNKPIGKQMLYNTLNDHPYQATDITGTGWSSFVNNVTNYESVHGTYPKEP